MKKRNKKFVKAVVIILIVFSYISCEVLSNERIDVYYIEKSSIHNTSYTHYHYFINGVAFLPPEDELNYFFTITSGKGLEKIPRRMNQKMFNRLKNLKKQKNILVSSINYGVINNNIYELVGKKVMIGYGAGGNYKKYPHSDKFSKKDLKNFDAVYLVGTGKEIWIITVKEDQIIYEDIKSSYYYKKNIDVEDPYFKKYSNIFAIEDIENAEKYPGFQRFIRKKDKEYSHYELNNSFRIIKKKEDKNYFEKKRQIK